MQKEVVLGCQKNTTMCGGTLSQTKTVPFRVLEHKHQNAMPVPITKLTHIEGTIMSHFCNQN